MVKSDYFQMKMILKKGGIYFSIVSAFIVR